MDFKEFALGQFIKYRALNDRRRKNGFMFDVEAALSERQRKVLDEKVKKNDALVVKVTKNYFAKCVNSRSVKLNGTQDNRNLMRSFGFSAYPEKDQSRFNISKICLCKNQLSHFFISSGEKFDDANTQTTNRKKFIAHHFLLGVNLKLCSIALRRI